MDKDDIINFTNLLGMLMDDQYEDVSDSESEFDLTYEESKDDTSSDITLSTIEEKDDQNDDIIDIKDNDKNANEDTNEDDNANEDTNEDDNEDDNKPGCKHYGRKCSIVSPCCGEIFQCRLCHDDAQYYSESNHVNDHQVDRFDIKEIVCDECDEYQLVSNECVNCKIQFANYFCGVCRLYSEKDNINHCDKCGICRVYDHDYIHCDECGMCVATEHECGAMTLKTDCSICMEDMFGSTLKASTLKCGHSFHGTCIEEHLKGDYRCPVCQRSLISLEMLANHIEAQIKANYGDQVPTGPSVVIYCYECHKTTKTIFNHVGVKCGNCPSYNTAIDHDNQDANDAKIDINLVDDNEDDNSDDTDSEYSIDDVDVLDDDDLAEYLDDEKLHDKIEN
jgi:RING finger and CHY zinc finger domain-containing protein 1